jgi:serine protease Do
MLTRLLSLIAVLSLVGFTAPVGAKDPPAPPKTYLGVLAEPTPANAVKPGVMVREVSPGSPAEKAGLKPGDEIVKVDNKDVKNFDDLMKSLAQHKPGDKLTLQALRDGKEQSLSVTLAEREAPPVSAPFPMRTAAFLGVQTQPLTAAEKSRLGVPVDAGVLVTDVVPGSAAARAGLRRDDVITRFNGKDITAPEELFEAVREAGAGKAVKITVARGKETQEIQGTLGESPGGLGFPPAFGERGDMRRLEQRLERIEKRLQELEQKLNQRGKN